MGCKQVESKKKPNQVPANTTVPAQPNSNAADDLPQVVKVEDQQQDIAQVKASTQVVFARNDKNDDLKIAFKVGDQLYERSYPPTTKVATIIEEIKKDGSINLPQENNLQWFINEVPININDELSSVVVDGKLEVTVKVIGLPSLASNYTQALQNYTSFVGKPLYNPFELLIFDKKFKTLEKISFNQVNLKSSEIHKFTKFSSYCNGKNRLYISGGEKDQAGLGNFWTIDLSSKNITKNPIGIPSMKYHSMIYIPDQYVFIVGGNSKKTYYYNTQDVNLTEWEELNVVRKEPALAFIDNKYLYAFSNINQHGNISFERTNLRAAARWELLHPLITPTSITLDQKLFGVCDVNKDKVIFLGGVMDNSQRKKFYEYDIENNEVKESSVPFGEYDFVEKTFIPFNDKTSFLLNTNDQGDIQVVIYNKRDTNLQSVKFIAKPQSNSSQVNSLIRSVYQNKQINYNLSKPLASSLYASPQVAVQEEKKYSNRPSETPQPSKDDGDQEHLPDRRIIEDPKEEQDNSGVECSHENQKKEQQQEEQIHDYYDNQKDMILVKAVKKTDEELQAEEDVERKKYQPEPQYEEPKKEEPEDVNVFGIASRNEVKPEEQRKEENAPESQFKNNTEEDNIENQRDEMNKAKAYKPDLGEHYIKDDSKQDNNFIPVKNFGGSLVRSSVVDNKKVRKSALPSVRRNSPPMKGSKIGISGEFDKNAINDMQSSKIAGIAGKKIPIS